MLDKEGIALIEDIRKALIEFRDQTKSSSVKKKTRKVTSQLIWDAESYIDELDNIKSTSKTQEEAVERARSLIRTAEEDALVSGVLTPDDTMHHIVSSRTGGDDLTDMEYSRSGPIIDRLSQKHQRRFSNTTGPRGNLPQEMSLSNAAHKFDDKATGLERESGIGKAVPKEFTAHNKGTAYYSNMRGVDMSDDAAVEAALDKKVAEQIDQARIAAAVDQPRKDYLAKNLTGDLVTDPDVIRKSYLQITKGGMKMNRAALLAAGAALPGLAMLPLSAQAAIESEKEAKANPQDWRKQAIAVADKISVAADTTEAAATTMGPLGVPVMAVAGGVANLAGLTSTLLSLPDSWRQAEQRRAGQTERAESSMKQYQANKRLKEQRYATMNDPNNPFRN